MGDGVSGEWCPQWAAAGRWVCRDPACTEARGWESPAPASALVNPQRFSSILRHNLMSSPAFKPFYSRSTSLKGSSAFADCPPPDAPTGTLPGQCFPGLCFPEGQTPHPPLPPRSERVPAPANLPQTQAIRTVCRGGNAGVNCPLPASASSRTYWKHRRSPHPPHPPHLPQPPLLPCPACLPHLHRLGRMGLAMGHCGPVCPPSPAASSCCCRLVLASVPGAGPRGPTESPRFPGAGVTRSPAALGPAQHTRRREG